MPEPQTTNRDEDGDRRDRWSERIDATHPMKNGDHKRYIIAMEMVGNRHTKHSLVELVNWLLQEVPYEQI